MRAKFDIAVDLAIEIQDLQVNKQVALRIITGVDYGDETSNRKVDREITMHKSTARAIASAMMGCAAQLE